MGANVIRKVFAGALLCALIAVPLATGLATLNPRVIPQFEWVRVAAVEEVVDAEPRRFPVCRGLRDAWTKHTPEIVGSVYLRRLTDGKVLALNCISPRPNWGTFLGYDAEHRTFQDPCIIPKYGSFDLDGKRLEENISPYDMTRFESRIADGAVWVKWPRSK